ncbi:hypothetical protein Cch01nite_09050 [Cellulomonas chitinilytica]|uniref:Uncharacterized protein n=1 Tax=Cellulomonas chitinilytica TaxID=398759 RepID=A0A919U080_9CELL|nr:hypothetical protein Cch01nite_09050 [Cellulomonas chitinilytica]
MERHRDGDRAADGHRVVRAVQHVGAGASGQGRETRLLPGEPHHTARDARGSHDDLGGGNPLGETVRQTLLAGDDEVDAEFAQRGGERVDVAPNPAQVRGDGGRIEEETHPAILGYP